jgi:hypothetical protein
VTNPYSTFKDRKTVPLPQPTFAMLVQYRDAMALTVPPGVSVSLHAAVHHALVTAMAAQAKEQTNEVR